ncbi:unnamed protein product [Paramecium sonneborni]|uniref:Uncharacterized protein n=1 Tax=Paramecium sonneborni TaxID=65129 RepID=A0A8S1PCP4_9CILI|nr:unnamed protein product [Paramecium sonneborni]
MLFIIVNQEIRNRTKMSFCDLEMILNKIMFLFFIARENALVIKQLILRRAEQTLTIFTLNTIQGT